MPVRQMVQRPNPTSKSTSIEWTPQRLLSSSYKDLGSPQKVTESFQNHLLSSQQCLSSLLHILFLETGKTGVHDHSVQIDMHDFLQSDPVLGNMLLRYPGTLLPLLEDAIVAAQREMIKRIDIFYDIYNQRTDANADVNVDVNTNTNTNNNPPVQKSNASVKGEKGTRVHARLVNLPPHSTNCKPSLSSLTSRDVGKILQLSGTVTRASTVQMYESQRAFKCNDKKKGCGASFVVKADLQCHNNALCHPSRCPTQGCKSKSFAIVEDAHHHNRSDYQEIKVQESVSQKNGRTGAIPRALLIKLQHDLVDSCQPGDDVVVVGTLMSHWQHLVNMGDINIGMAIHAHSVRVVHGGGGDNGGSGSGSSWDYIFDGDRNNRNSGDGDDGDKGDAEKNDSDGDSTSNSMKGRGMVREEIVKDFSAFWKEDVNQTRPIAARNYICQAVCPTLYGLSLVKLALLLTLIGGSSAGQGRENAEAHQSHSMDGVKNSHLGKYGGGSVDEEEDEGTPVQFSLFGDDDSLSSPTVRNHGNNVNRNMRHQSKDANATVKTRRREQSHLLLVGDPGCGKSQFLRFAAALCPRSVLTSGSGTTSAGLTCAAIRDDTSKEFTLEAGALVLADRGVCAIDEFSCIKPADRTTIHEAMEQGTLSVAKAGIVCKLNCRATVIAVTNAKGGIYDHEKPFTVNVGIEPPLLSRFDLIFKLIDGSDAAKDDNVATFLLNRAIRGAGYECSKASNGFAGRPHWNIDKLRAYIATIKSCFHPCLSPDASLLLERHYSECRSSESIEVQVTVRLLESLIRLAQAHARLMHRDVVELDDAVAIILLMECTVASTSASSFNSSLYVDPTTAVFPDDDAADIEFILDKMKVLEKHQMLDRLTPHEVRIIEERNAASAIHNTQSNGNGWEHIEAENSLQYSNAPTYPTPGKQHGLSPSNVTAAAGGVVRTSQDHYGRFTQTKATPSPPSGLPRNYVGRDAGINETDGVDSTRKRRRRNHSAD